MGDPSFDFKVHTCICTYLYMDVYELIDDSGKKGKWFYKEEIILEISSKTQMSVLTSMLQYL